MLNVNIYTDGSVSGNGTPQAIGGWAVILQAIKHDSLYECCNCSYEGSLDKFEDTEYDGDVWGMCPECHSNAMLLPSQDTKTIVAEIEKYGKLTYEDDNCPVTNNRAEMYAVLRGLESVHKKCDITVYSDSELCIKTLNGIYSRKNNTDLWKRLDDRCMELKNMGCSIMFQWVRGHDGNPFNERCDKLASKVKKGLI